MIIHPFNSTNISRMRDDPSTSRDEHNHYRISKKKIRQLNNMAESQASGAGFPTVNAHTESQETYKGIGGNAKQRARQKQLEDIYTQTGRRPAYDTNPSSLSM